MSRCLVTAGCDLSCSSLGVESTGIKQQSVDLLRCIRYPIMATQWHPEKNNFEWLAAPGTVPHTSHAVQLSEYVVVCLCRGATVVKVIV